jgi:hypothetical protein
LAFSLAEPLASLANWARRNWTEVQAARQDWYERTDQ